MKQIALDIGLTSGPTLHNFFPGRNEAALGHLELWVGAPVPGRVTRSPVPTYLWGSQGCGKTHLLKAVRDAVRENRARAPAGSTLAPASHPSSTRTGRWC